MSYIILDLDNCISDDAWRVNKIRRDAEDPFHRYHNYHMLSSFDTARNTHLTNGREVIISTSRPEFYEQITKHWLYTKDITPIELLMRKEGDYRSTVTVKREHYHYVVTIMKIPREEIYCVYDDNAEVIAMYDKLGLDTQRVFINNPKQYERHRDENSSRNSG